VRFTNTNIELLLQFFVLGRAGTTGLHLLYTFGVTSTSGISISCNFGMDAR
jgi:hypothetical protein